MKTGGQNNFLGVRTFAPFALFERLIPLFPNCISIYNRAAALHFHPGEKS